MTAGTEAADKKNISQIVMKRLHFIPYRYVKYKLHLYLDKIRLNRQLDAGFCELKNTSHHFLVSCHSLTHHLGFKNNMCLKMKYHWERSIKKEGKVLVECSVCAASLNCQLFSGRQSEKMKQQRLV